ncbi:YjzC family protein [Thalassobacillus sp. CUG 92003]|uniref:YjzC family protein n=1 Tax=Thalassobacillus sp. CUG 92003 TaxID=2736641 RepID=UPI0015E70F47|nr:YjzC family protein [Thalassobacillus sp. CUG 92003]
MSEQIFKTGDKAPSSGKYVVVEFVKGGSPDEEAKKKVRIAQDETFPACPVTELDAYWTKS